MQRRQVTRDELIRGVRELEAETGRPVTVGELCEALGCSTKQVYRHFRNWKALRRAAGVSASRGRRYTTQEILDALRQAVEEAGPDLSFFRFQRMTGISYPAIARHFGNWGKLRAQLGLPGRSFSKRFSDEELLAELDRVARRLGRFPTRREIARHGRYGGDTYRTRFGRKRQVIQALRKYRLVQACIRRFGPEYVRQPVNYGE